MKILRSIAVSGLCLLLSLSPLTAAAQGEFAEEGRILALTHNTINLSDAAYRLLPTVKVELSDSTKGSLSDLKVGDFAEIIVISIDRKRFVDTIRVLDQLEPNETIPPPR